MTERKPADETVPDVGRPADELWWVRRKLRDEHLVGLPPALAAALGAWLCRR